MLSRVTKRIEASIDSRYQQNEREKNFEKKAPSQKFADYVSGYLDYAHYHDGNFFSSEWYWSIIWFPRSHLISKDIAIESQATIPVLQAPPMPPFLQVEPP